MDDPIQDHREGDETSAVVTPPDGSINFATYSLPQLRELRHLIDARRYPASLTHLLAEIQRLQPIESADSATSRPPSGRFTPRDGMIGWLTAKFRRLRVYGSGSLDVGGDGVTVNGWQRTWLSIPEQVSLHIPSEQIRNAALNGSCVRFEWKRPYRPTQIVEYHAPSAEAAERLLSALPTQQSAGFAARWVELQSFNQRLEKLSPLAWLTPSFMLINIVVYVTMLIATPGSLSGFDLPTLQRWGGNVGLLVINGQWWRLVSAVFIHANLPHVLTNMWVLWNIGRLTERLYGKWPFAILYVGGGLIASLSSVAWDVNHVSVGASGAIFGLFGAFLVFLIRRDTRVPAAIVRAHWLSTLVFVLFNLISGFLSTGIDTAAHVGGLLGGFVLGWLLARPLDIEARDEFPFKPTLASAMTVALCTLAMIWQVVGFGSRFSVPEQYFKSRPWFVTGERDNQKRWGELAQQGAAQSISTSEFGRRMSSDVVPFWESTAHRLQAELATLPTDQRPFGTLVAKLAQQRLEWAQTLATIADADGEVQWGHKIAQQSQDVQLTVARIERLEMRGSLDHRASGLSTSPLVVSIRNFLVGVRWKCIESPSFNGHRGLAATDSRSDGPALRQIAACRTQQLFMSGDYKALDALINQSRNNLNDLPDGSSSLSGVMYGFGDLFEYGRKDLSEWLAKLADWRRAVSGSVNPDLVEVLVFREWAWTARGRDVAKEISRQSWAAFAYRSEMAQAALDDIGDRSDAGPVWYELAVSVGLDTNKSVDDLRDIVDRGKARYPTYHPIYLRMIHALMPRWRGSYDEEKHFVNRMTKRYSATPDVGLYAQLYWSYASLEDDQINIFDDAGASWGLMKQGFQTLVARYPHSDYLLNGFAKFSCVADDKNEFEKLRPALKEHFSASVWSDRVSLLSCEAKFAPSNAAAGK